MSNEYVNLVTFFMEQTLCSMQVYLIYYVTTSAKSIMSKLGLVKTITDMYCNKVLEMIYIPSCKFQ